MLGKRKQDSTIEIIKTAIYAIILTVFIKTCAYDTFKIPSGSMIPNLIVGDRLIVNKFLFGYGSDSFPLGVIPFNGRIMRLKNPERGDVIVFKKGKLFYIKRIIGLPGDKVKMKDRDIYINGNKQNLEYIEDVKQKFSSYKKYREKNIDGKYYEIQYLKFKSDMDSFNEITIPKDKYFVMGDNRSNSIDSRSDFIGLVPEDKIIGRAELIIFSIKSSYSFIRFERFIKNLRPKNDKPLTLGLVKKKLRI